MTERRLIYSFFFLDRDLGGNREAGALWKDGAVIHTWKLPEVGGTGEQGRKD